MRRLILALAVMAVTFIGFLTFGEEYGWRGYLLPKLLPLGEVKAAVIVGLIWGPWHAPILIAGLNYSGVNPFAAIGIFTSASSFAAALAASPERPTVVQRRSMVASSSRSPHSCLNCSAEHCPRS